MSSHTLRGRRSRGVAVLVLLLVPVALSCARFRFQRPEVTLEAVQVTGIGLSGGSLNLLLDVYNPNGYELRGSRVEAAITLEDTHFGDALLERPIRLSAGDTTVVEVPITFTWSGVGAGARALLSRGSVQYRLEGTIRLDVAGRLRNVELSNAGSVTVRDLVR